jgi:hypothetical protein
VILRCSTPRVCGGVLLLDADGVQRARVRLPERLRLISMLRMGPRSGSVLRLRGCRGFAGILRATVVRPCYSRVTIIGTLSMEQAHARPIIAPGYTRAQTRKRAQARAYPPHAQVLCGRGVVPQKQTQLPPVGLAWRIRIFVRDVHADTHTHTRARVRARAHARSKLRTRTRTQARPHCCRYETCGVADPGGVEQEWRDSEAHRLKARTAPRSGPRP